MASAPSTKIALLWTSDGGAHWTDLTPADPYASQQMSMGSALFFLTPQTGWFAVDITPQHGPGSTIVIEHTSDGGIHWQSSTFTSPYVGGIYLDFTSPSTGWILSLSTPGAGLMGKALFQTTNGGQTWQQVNCDCGQQRISLPGDSYPDGISFNGSRGFVTALYHGEPYVWLYGTADDGHAFQRVQVSVPAAFNNSYANPYPPVFSGGTGSMFIQFVGQPSEVLVYRSTDSGATWKPSGGPPVPSSANLLTSGWSSPNDGYVLSSDDQDIYLTLDAGASWAMEPLPAGAASPMQGPQIVTFFDAQHGLLYATDSSGVGALYGTSDGANTWTKLSAQVMSP